MSLTPLTLRIESSLHEELKYVSRLAKTSMNQLIVKAIRAQLQQMRSNLEQDLERTLEQLRAYSERDRDFTKAIETFAAAEVQHTDPIEGELLEVGEPTEAQRQFRELLAGA